MPKGIGYGSGSAPGFARETGAPPIVKEQERAHSRNTLDQARPAAPDRGQTAGGSRQGGGSGGNKATD